MSMLFLLYFDLLVNEFIQNLGSLAVHFVYRLPFVLQLSSSCTFHQGLIFLQLLVFTLLTLYVVNCLYSLKDIIDVVYRKLFVFLRTLLTFYVVNEVGRQEQIRPGVEVVSLLKKKLHSSPDVLDYRFVSLETVGRSS